jgi:two-component system, OmpR family, KDP operon response regulator KdpE
MTTAITGAGNIGSTLARNLTGSGGQQVVLAVRDVPGAAELADQLSELVSVGRPATVSRAPMLPSSPGGVTHEGADHGAHVPDVVIVDLGRCDLDSIVRRLRRWTATPIVVLAGPADRTGKAVATGRDAAQVRLGDLVVDLAAKRVLRPRENAGTSGQGADIRLTPTEWRLLEVLLRHPGQLLGRQRLLAEAWGPGYARATGNLRLYMTQLRRKLEPDPSRPRWLVTEPGLGYRFQPDP